MKTAVKFSTFIDSNMTEEEIENELHAQLQCFADFRNISDYGIIRYSTPKNTVIFFQGGEYRTEPGFADLSYATDCNGIKIELVAWFDVDGDSIVEVENEDEE